MEVAAIIAIIAKFVGPIGHYIVCPVADCVCPFKNLWKYNSNLEELVTKVEDLNTESRRVQGFTNPGVEPLEDVAYWLVEATNLIDEVSRLIIQDNPEEEDTGCYKLCTCSNLKECYQHRNNVARKLKHVVRLLKRGRRSTSLWEFFTNLEKLKKEVEKLKLKRDSMQRLIKVGEEPLPTVKAWQDKVEEIVNEFVGLTSEHNPEQQSKVTRMLEKTVQLLQEEAQLREVSWQPIPKQESLHASIQQESLESRKKISRDVIAALRNTDVNMVGIYGMGGIGKTTLAKKVGCQVMQDKLFDRMVYVEVSQSPNIRIIQGVIADCLGLQFTQETEPGRAIKLYDELKEKRVLIILDNIWKGIKLEEIGIPHGKDSKGVKLLIIARSREVLMKDMDSQCNFHVQTLSEADAWILFKSIVGMCVELPYLRSIPQEVAKKCGGIPIAIVTVAKTLKGTKSQDEWKDALRRLSNPSSESFEGITKELYNSIKLSYDYLPKNLKEIFLLSSRMGCTNDASVRVLFIYGLGLGLFDRFDTMDDALCNVYTSINQLKDASLLLDAPKTHGDHGFPAYASETFALHDVICDVARSIASGNHVFNVQGDHIPRSLTSEITLKSCTSITLYNIGTLPENPYLDCPKLKFLLVKPKYLLEKIPDTFFKEMSNLIVLHFIETDLTSLPTSFGCLVNLQALCLEDCLMKDIAVIGDMKKLEILSFCGSTIEKLPKEMGQLTNLRWVDLTDCRELTYIPSKVLSSLSRIEALYMRHTNIQWELARPDIEGGQASIDELKHLGHLDILEIHILDAKMFRGLISSEPKRYKICIVGKPWLMCADWKLHSNNVLRKLRLRLDTKEDWIISQLPGVEDLGLAGGVRGAINLLDDLDRDGFPQLQHLEIESNYQCLCIVNSASFAVLPSLESLIVKSMGMLENICKCPLAADSFFYLKTIRIWDCERLSNVFCISSIARVLPNLTDLAVGHCNNMEEIFSIDEQGHSNSTEVYQDIELCQLRKLMLTHVPKLKTFCRKAKTGPLSQWVSHTSADVNLSCLFNDKVVLSNIETLVISCIKSELIWNNRIRTVSSIQNLICLYISHLANLRGLCLGDHIKFPLLKEMTICSCPRVDEVLFDKVEAPNLEIIKVICMDNLKMIWQTQAVEQSVPKLKSLEVRKCPELLSLIWLSGKLLSLETLDVGDCHSLEKLFIMHKINCNEPHLTASESKEVCTSVVSLKNLRTLRVSDCRNLKSFFHLSTHEQNEENAETIKFVFSKLASLELYRMPQLGTFFPSRYSVEWPMLRLLWLWDDVIPDTDDEGQMQQALFLIRKAFPCLEDLMLDGRQLETMWQGHDSECLFQKFKILRVVTHMDYNAEYQPVLRYISQEKYMWQQNFKLDLILSNFEKILVDGCDSFISLMPPSASFQNLTALEVYYYNGLKNIGTFSDLKNLMKLVQLTIHECQNIVEVVGNPGDISGDRFVFNRLRRLALGCSSSLQSFCSLNINLEFPALEELRVYCCPNMKIFCKGVVTAPRLNEIRMRRRSVKLCSDMDVNIAIQKIHEEER